MHTLRLSTYLTTVCMHSHSCDYVALFVALSVALFFLLHQLCMLSDAIESLSYKWKEILDANNFHAKAFQSFPKLLLPIGDFWDFTWDKFKFKSKFTNIRSLMLRSFYANITTLMVHQYYMNASIMLRECYVMLYYVILCYVNATILC